MKAAIDAQEAASSAYSSSNEDSNEAPVRSEQNVPNLPKVGSAAAEDTDSLAFDFEDTLKAKKKALIDKSKVAGIWCLAVAFLRVLFGFFGV